jgi:hypothetical protein
VIFPLAVVLSALLLAEAARADETEAGALATTFCAAVRAGDEVGAEALMTPELQTAIAKLRATDAAFRTAHPDEKPPLGDGLRLTAFPDYPESCAPAEVTSESVVLTYVPVGAADGLWRDQLLLVPVGNTLKVADILYAPDGTYRFSTWLAESAAP